PLTHVIDRCLAKEPESRWDSAKDVKFELEWAEKSQPAAVPVPAKTPVRTRLSWVVAALAVVVALALAWVAWRATRPVDRPLMRFSADLGPAAVEGRNITAAISPDGTRLTFVVRGSGGKEQLATRLLDQAQATLLPGT